MDKVTMHPYEGLVVRLDFADVEEDGVGRIGDNLVAILLVAAAIRCLS